jgi:hypothetical protein
MRRSPPIGTGQSKEVRLSKGGKVEVIDQLTEICVV